MITHTLFDGIKAIKAFNDHLELMLIPEFGSQVISLIDKQSGQDILVKPETFADLKNMPFMKGIPVLFPPNRVKEGTFSFNGSSYNFPINENGKNHIHGFVYDKPWKLIAEKNNGEVILIETELLLENPPIYKNAFIRLTFELDGPILRQKATVENKGSEPFPWGIGYHTAFVFDESVSTFSLTAKKQWSLDEQAIPTGELTAVPPFKKVRLQGKQLDEAFLAEKKENEAVLVNEKTGRKITYRTDSFFTQWVVYNGNGKEGFICPEPYTCITNAFNLDLPQELTGLQVLQPGEKATVVTEIEVS